MCTSIKKNTYNTLGYNYVANVYSIQHTQAVFSRR